MLFWLFSLLLWTVKMVCFKNRLFSWCYPLLPLRNTGVGKGAGWANLSASLWEDTQEDQNAQSISCCPCRSLPLLWFQRTRIFFSPATSWRGGKLAKIFFAWLHPENLKAIRIDILCWRNLGGVSFEFGSVLLHGHEDACPFSMQHGNIRKLISKVKQNAITYLIPLRIQDFPAILGPIEHHFALLVSTVFVRFCDRNDCWDFRSHIFQESHARPFLILYQRMHVLVLIGKVKQALQTRGRIRFVHAGPQCSTG